MYSNDLTQIRQGLVSYIGSCVDASPYEGRAARQTVSSILIEEAIHLSQEKKGEPFDLYVLKPLLRGTVHVLKQRVQELEKLPGSPEVKEKIKEYTATAESLLQLVALIK